MNSNFNSNCSLHFPAALIGDQWLTDVVVDVSKDGWITGVSPCQTALANATRVHAVALPGIPNLHSHAFQRGFAGLTEFRTTGRDNFWTWREKMYEFVESMTPERMYVIARQLFIEMRLAGYTWVGEFHYLHQQQNGSDPTLFIEVLLQAAREVGIGLCVIPVFYQRGGFENEPLVSGQKQFHLTSAKLQGLMDYLDTKLSNNVHTGLALHSLRAVNTSDGLDLLSAIRTKRPDCPIHIHVAEQTKEVDDCLRVHGVRSVGYLFDNFPVDEHWCLIHATHLTESERRLIAKSGAVVGLCPTTEANLGDGIFTTAEFISDGGRFGIGGDSHCSVDLREELRLLEYAQRLRHRQRAILTNDEKSVGRFLFQRAAEGGSQALGIKSGRIDVGYRADMVLVDPEHPAIAGAEGDRLIDRLIFCNHGNPIIGSIVGGQEFSLRIPEIQRVVLNSQTAFRDLVFGNGSR